MEQKDMLIFCLQAGGMFGLGMYFAKFTFEILDLFRDWILKSGTSHQEEQ